MNSPDINLLSLPNEIIHKIIQKLHYEDLSSVIAVCRKLRRFGENPLLWSNFALCLSCKSAFSCQNLSAALDIPRLMYLRNLVVCGQQLAPDYSQIQSMIHSIRYNRNISVYSEYGNIENAFRSKSSLTNLTFSSINLSRIDPGVLCEVVTRVKTVSLDLNFLTFEQTSAIFRQVT